MDKNAVFFVPKALDPTFNTAITFWLPLVTLITEVLLAWIIIEPFVCPNLDSAFFASPAPFGLPRNATSLYHSSQPVHVK